jgi:hypothetical protein
MKDKMNWPGLWQELAKKIKKYYSYFLIFYITVLLFAVIFPAARTYFYWPGLHGAFIILTILAAVAYNLLHPKEARPIEPFRRFFFWFRHFLRLLSRPFGRFLIKLIARIKAFKRKDWLKVLIVVLIAVFGLFKGVSAWEFVVLFYAACSLVYILDSRWAAGVALLFLAACPVLLISNREILAESSAISAFYFLVITVLTQIRELRRDRGTESEEDEKTDEGEKGNEIIGPGMRE